MQWAVATHAMTKTTTKRWLKKTKKNSSCSTQCLGIPNTNEGKTSNPCKWWQKETNNVLHMNFLETIQSMFSRSLACHQSKYEIWIQMLFEFFFFKERSSLDLDPDNLILCNHKIKWRKFQCSLFIYLFVCLFFSVSIGKINEISLCRLKRNRGTKKRTNRSKKPFHFIDRLLFGVRFSCSKELRQELGVFRYWMDGTWPKYALLFQRSLLQDSVVNIGLIWHVIYRGGIWCHLSTVVDDHVIVMLPIVLRLSNFKRPSLASCLFLTLHKALGCGVFQ